jgi:uncharacterized protein
VQIDERLLEILACPKCHSPLRPEDPSASSPPGVDGELVCTGAGCGLAYPVREGIPVLLIDEGRPPA